MRKQEHPPSEDPRTLFRIVRGVFATGFLLFGMATYYQWRQYGETRPTFLVDQDSGRLRPLVTQNWTVYLTRGDQFRLYALGVAAAACLATAIALDIFVLQRREDE